MRQFSSPGFRLWNLGVAAKVLYSAFCFLTFLGVASSALYYVDLVGAGTRGIKRYYAGEGEAAFASAPASHSTAASPGGPAIDVPDEVERARPPIVVAVSYRKLLEVTHFHLFTLPVVLLIVGHLFLATGLGDRAKLAWIGVAAASVVAHLATPWLVRYGSSNVAILHAFTGGAMTLTMAVLTIYPTVAMWRGGRASTQPQTDSNRPG